MSKTLKTLTAVALSVALALPVSAEEVTADTVVATVNGKEITLGHMLAIRATLPEQYQQMPNDALWEGIMDQIVQQEALAQSKDAHESRRVKVALDNERRSLLASEAITVVAERAATDEAIEALYKSQYVDGDKGVEYNASHILVETKEEAEAILIEVKGGADFAATAQAKSTGPSGPNGGSLGWFAAGMMVEPFQNAVEAMNPGDVTGPVQTQFGWHVIKLNETRTQEAPALEAVRGQLVQQIQQQAVQDRIAKLVADADVTRKGIADFDTSVLSNVELLEE
ncbi:peptidylprolyl isomerase [Tropicibacter naphthalenivorans]|uniref:Parvulin-like PPIase n=1 Tax=Tropicibacter naphthalenivorans TaxID=441103 RepID=A0A0P1FZR8_9RHOB|nr:peptidylprolyl isomerase [Tropicibacter naphthalenivorans]CUH74664.1 putative parvulin-type peptidyl-prolyl cis-trans isomerase precursor [Tropicibacter naphthalenivorans]SMC49975.1 peptidyl-prolyl cis-trans isomerase C [Tropicibacter naphthalenivorans]